MLNFKEEEFYNGEVKVRYLESFDEEKTAYITSFMYKGMKDTEQALGKDVYEMSRNELAEVLKALAASTEDSAYIKAVQLEQYIDWAIENGYTDSNLNPLSNVNKREWAAPFVAKYKQLAFTRNDILEMCAKLYNYGDKAVLLAIFEGVSGEGYSEILNLQTKDLKEKDGKYFANLHDKDGSERTIEISEELFTFLHKTDEEEFYYNKNGTAEGDRYSKSELQESDKIFKKTTKGKQGGELNLFYVNRKFQIYKDIFGMRFLRAKNVENSGMMHMANEFYQQHGELTTDHIKEIATQYNTTISKINGKEERVTTVIRLLLQSDLFEELYGYKIIK